MRNTNALGEYVLLSENATSVIIFSFAQYPTKTRAKENDLGSSGLRHREQHLKLFHNFFQVFQTSVVEELLLTVFEAFAQIDVQTFIETLFVRASLPVRAMLVPALADLRNIKIRIFLSRFDEPRL